MANFLDLPRHVRLYIYRLVASHARVFKARTRYYVAANHLCVYERDIPGAREGLVMSTSSALLQSSKTVYNEYHPVFWKYATLDLSDYIDPRKGMIYDLPERFPPSTIRNLKVNARVFAGAGAMRLLKSLSGLKQLLYYGANFVHHMNRLENRVERLMRPVCNEKDCVLCTGMLVEMNCEINYRARFLVGQAGCADMWDDSDHLDAIQLVDDPIRRVVAVWEYLGKPFTLVARISIIRAWRRISRSSHAAMVSLTSAPR